MIMLVTQELCKLAATAVREAIVVGGHPAKVIKTEICYDEEEKFEGIKVYFTFADPPPAPTQVASPNVSLTDILEEPGPKPVEDEKN